MSLVSKKIALVALVVGLVSFAFTAISPAKTFAQTTEEQRNDALEQQLLLSLPATTENPNFNITFTDPSGKGVTLSIDGKEAVKISNPYTLPTLGIGKHVLTFKFNDNQQTPETLDRDLVVIPRSPQIKTPVANAGILTLNGTGLAGSAIEILLVSPIKTQSFETSVDTAGNWTFTSDKAIEDGRYTVVALARKYGYSSKYSETVTFDIGTPAAVNTATDPAQTGTVTQTSTIPVNFQFSSFTADNIVETLKANKDLLIAAGVIALFGMLLGMLLGRVFRNNETKKAENLLRTVFQKNTDGTDKKNNDRSSIIDKLENAKVPTQIKEEEKAREEEVKDKTTITIENATVTEINATQSVDRLPSVGEPEEKVLSDKDQIEETKTPDEEKEQKSDSKKNKKSKDKKKNSKAEDVKEEKTPETSELKITDVIPPVKAAESEPESSQTETVTTDKVISKEDFLMKFKDFDPDSKDTSERKPARNIKISLTSSKTE